MLETSARLLQLLSLFQSRRYWSGAELSSRLEVTSRTVRRDVDKLRSLGYPIHSSSGTEGGYQLGAGADMPPLLLDDQEAVAVAVGLRYAATGRIEGVEEASVRALAKIEQILPPRLGRRVAALQAVTVTQPGAREASVDARTVTILAGACRDRELLRFRYSDHTAKATSRRVEPFRLVHTGQRWYLVAWDLDREDWRTFRVDRIGSRPVPGDRFPARAGPAGDLAAFVTEGYWRSVETCRARVRVSLAAAEMARRYASGVIEPIDDESCFLELGASCYERLAMQLAWLGADFTVESPPELEEAVAALAKRLGRATAGGRRRDGTDRPPGGDRASRRGGSSPRS